MIIQGWLTGTRAILKIGSMSLNNAKGMHKTDWYQTRIKHEVCAYFLGSNICMGKKQLRYNRNTYTVYKC